MDIMPVLACSFPYVNVISEINIYIYYYCHYPINIHKDLRYRLPLVIITILFSGGFGCVSGILNLLFKSSWNFPADT